MNLWQMQGINVLLLSLEPKVHASICVPKPCFTFGTGIADKLLGSVAKGISVRQQGIHRGSLDKMLVLCIVGPLQPER